jgi:hypothetical protein
LEYTYQIPFSFKKKELSDSATTGEKLEDIMQRE